MSASESRVPSPCVRNCCLSEDDVCLGCFRRLDEITCWGEANDEKRRLILDMARGRKAAYDAKMAKWNG